MDIIIKIHNKGEEFVVCFGHNSWGGKRQKFDVFLGIPRKTSNTQPYFSFW